MQNMYLYKIISNVELENWGEYLRTGLNIMDKQYHAESKSNYKNYFSPDSYVCPYEELFIVPIHNIFHYLKLNSVAICRVYLPHSEELKISHDDYWGVTRWKVNRYILSEPKKINLDIIKFLLQRKANWQNNYDKIIDWAFYNNYADITKYMMCIGRMYKMDAFNILTKICQTGDIKLLHFFEYIMGLDDTTKKYGIIISCIYKQEKLLNYFMDFKNHSRYISKPYISEWKYGFNSCLRFVLKYACDKNNISMINYLTCDLPDSKFHVEMNNLLIYSVSVGNIDILNYTIAMGANIKTKNNKPIGTASKKGHLDIVKLLVKLGANIDGNNNYALRMACQHGHYDVVNYLLNKNKSAYNNYDIYLMNACENNHIEIVKLLLDTGANIKIINNYPVRIAAKYGFTKLFKYLVSRGANYKDKNHNCIRQAIKNEHYGIVDFIINHNY
ncbi:repeat protein [Moumouvirus goulette]|uniref:Repeat protein n=1 Tax=Moumouvirus goulette TaxID=1247379 RepID=M1PNK4_9VIRU|nr:repeat protein [Moumouvirus goulette]AGF85601.1 repeat protein [Moumouvirus goulette]